MLKTKKARSDEVPSMQDEFKALAERELGLNEVEIKAGHFGAACKALVEFKMLGASETPDIVPLSQLQIVSIIAEQHGERIRVVAHGGHFIEGMVVAGGNDGADSNGVGGLWTVVSINKHSTDPAALAIQRASLHRTFRKDQLPDGVKAIPEGLYKDAMAEERKSFSLWSEHRLHKVPNGRLQVTAMAALVLSGSQRKAGVTTDVSTFVAPRLLVELDEIEPLKPRFLSTDTADSDLFLKAQDKIDDIAAWCGARGTWDIDGLLKAGVTGEVQRVHPQTGVIDIFGDDVGQLFQPPTAKIIDIINKCTGFYVPSLKLVPLVEKGDQVGPETVLYGPMEKLPQATVKQLRRMSCEADTSGAWLTGVRLMALLASTTVVDGKTFYPIELVVPTAAKQVAVQVAGEGIRGRWDARIQRIALDRHPSKHLLAAGLGYKFDLFSTSHRAVAAGRIDAARTRDRLRAEQARQTKRAKQQQTAATGVAEKTATPTKSA